MSPPICKKTLQSHRFEQWPLGCETIVQKKNQKISGENFLDVLAFFIADLIET
jgi:hypothetical protein